MIRFIELFDNSPLEGTLCYKVDEYSFNFDLKNAEELRRRIGSKGTTSLSMGTLQIEVSIAKKLLLYVWGYLPWLKWRRDVLVPPTGIGGSIAIESSNILKKGVSISMSELDEIPIIYDPEANWLCLGETRAGGSAVSIEFATNIIATIEDYKLVSLWLHPKFDSAIYI